MKKLIILFLVTLLSSICIKAQENGFYIDANYNTFSHKKLKSFQEEFRADIVDVQLIKNDEFPTNIGFTIGYKVSELNASFFASYTSTGGKVSYSDYSGVIRITEAIEGITFGGEYLLNLIPISQNKGEFNVGFRGFFILSKLDIESYTSIADQSETDSIGFNSVDLGGGVRVIYEYPVGFFKLRASLGFDIVLGGKYLLKEDQEFYLQDNSGDAVKNGWTGLRAGLGIFIPLQF